MTKPLGSPHTRAIASPRITASPKMPFAHPSPSSYDNRLKTVLYVLLALIGAIVLYLLLAPLFRTQKSGGESASSEKTPSSPKASSEGEITPKASAQLSRAMNAASGGDGVATTGHPLYADADGNLAQASNLTLDREHPGGKIIFGGGKASIQGRNDTLDGGNADVDGTMHIYSSERIYLLPKDGVHLTKDGGANGNLSVHGDVSTTNVTASGNVKGNQICIGATCLTEDHLKYLTNGFTLKIQDHGHEPNGWSFLHNYDNKWTGVADDRYRTTYIMNSAR